METDLEEDDWENLDEGVEEYGEEEGEYIPPGYQAAEGPFKSFCTCENFVTCQFCSWFYKIKECKRHGQATRRPFKPCTCPSSQQNGEEKLQSYEELQQSLSYLKEPQSDLVHYCVCEPKPPQPIHCDCLNFLKEKPTEKPHVAENEYREIEELEEEIGELEEVRMLEEYGEVAEEDEIWPPIEYSGGDIEKPDKSDVRQGGITKKEGKTCTCPTHYPPRSGSSTEPETDTEESTSSSSVEFIRVGEGLPFDGDDSSDLTPSETSSAGGATFDPTRIKWYGNASDRSVDSITEDELDESEVDRIAAHWGIHNIYGRLPTSVRKRKEEPREKPKSGATRQYLVVQHNRIDVSKNPCKKKKDRPKPYYYKLMEL